MKFKQSIAIVVLKVEATNDMYGSFTVEGRDKLKVVLISMYFMMTSLSTVGFGDLYPKSNFERIFGSIILLSGVAIFSYIMSKCTVQMIKTG